MASLVIPGYAEAVRREGFVREVAFLPVNDSVAGFEVVPMTLRHWSVLRMARSPFLCGGTPEPEHVAAFLWALSPEWQMGDCKARRAFYRRCRVFLPPMEPWLKTSLAMVIYRRKVAEHLEFAAEVIKAVRTYVDETFQDAPGGKSNGAQSKTYFADVAWISALFAREYGWSEEITLTMPLRRVFQYIKEIAKYRNPKAILTNPSDDVIGRWQAGLQKQRIKAL